MAETSGGDGSVSPRMVKRARTGFIVMFRLRIAQEIWALNLKPDWDWPGTNGSTADYVVRRSVHTVPSLCDRNGPVGRAARHAVGLALHRLRRGTRGTGGAVPGTSAKVRDVRRQRRPGVVWFGEALPAAALAEATRETEACDLFISIGTSSIVFPAAGLLDTAIARKIKTVEINTEETQAAGYVTGRCRARPGRSCRCW